MEPNRVVRASVYLEPIVRQAADKAAAKKGETFSSWARKVLMEELILAEELDSRTLQQLAVNK